MAIKTGPLQFCHIFLFHKYRNEIRFFIWKVISAKKRVGVNIYIHIYISAKSDHSPERPWHFCISNKLISEFTLWLILDHIFWNKDGFGKVIGDIFKTTLVFLKVWNYCKLVSSTFSNQERRKTFEIRERSHITLTKRR